MQYIRIYIRKVHRSQIFLVNFAHVVINDAFNQFLCIIIKEVGGFFTFEFTFITYYLHNDMFLDNPSTAGITYRLHKFVFYNKMLVTFATISKTSSTTTTTPSTSSGIWAEISKLPNAIRATIRKKIAMICMLNLLVLIIQMKILYWRVAGT